MFDIVVIGGNLSGTFAAINAVDKGLKVAIIESHKKPFFPPHCGEAIADVTADFLNINQRKCPKNMINEVKINVTSSKNYTLNLSRNKIYVIDRNFLENSLLNEAERKNVNMYLGRRMVKFNPPNEIIMENNEKIFGKIIIDASGISCAIGKQIGINTKLNPRDIGVCIQSRIKSGFNPNKMYMWWGEPYAPFGYAWLFPKNENLANIGLGIIGGQKLDLNNLLQRYIEKMINGKYETLYTFKACEPMVKPLDNIISDNILFVGDSARLVDPASGAGIHNAVISGTLAGIIAAKYILGEINSLDLYQKLMKSKINKICKTYRNKCKLNTLEKYDRGFDRLFFTINVLNKIIPNFYQGQVSRILKRDIKKVEFLR